MNGIIKYVKILKRFKTWFPHSIQKSLIKELLKVNKSQKQFMASSILPKKPRTKLTILSCLSLTFSLDVFFYFSSAQPVCENMPGIFSWCINMFYQILPKNWTFIEKWKTRLPRLQKIPCSHLSNKRTCPLILFKK